MLSQISFSLAVTPESEGVVAVFGVEALLVLAAGVGALALLGAGAGLQAETASRNDASKIIRFMFGNSSKGDGSGDSASMLNRAASQ
jgi:hypothetical protein